MSKSLTLLRLDYFCIKEYRSPKYLFVFFGFLLLFAVTMDSPVSAIGMFMIYGMFYTSYPFAVAEKTPLDLLYASLPLQQKDLILGRYLFALSVNLFTGASSFAVCMALALLRGQPVQLQEALMTVAACFYLYSVMELFQFPFFFKIGYNKARLLVLLPVAALIALFLTVSRIGRPAASLEHAVQWAIANPLAPIVLLLSLWVLLLFGSMALSRRFYARREF